MAVPDVPKNYGSFGWVIGTEQEINAILPRGRVWSTLPILVPYTLHSLPGNTNI
jgi:hypothetical protein